MDKDKLQEVISFLTQYRGKGCWSIDIEKQLASLFTSIRLIQDVQELVNLGYTKEDILAILGK